MLKIWGLILFGMIVIPLIAQKTNELEDRLNAVKEGTEVENAEKNRLKSKEDIEFSLKLLKYSSIVIFGIIVIAMINFSSEVIFSD